VEGLHFGCAVAVLLCDRSFDFQVKYTCTKISVTVPLDAAYSYQSILLRFQLYSVCISVSSV
jgi:hypothetical protein